MAALDFLTFQLLMLCLWCTVLEIVVRLLENKAILFLVLYGCDYLLERNRNLFINDAHVDQKNKGICVHLASSILYLGRYHFSSLWTFVSDEYSCTRDTIGSASCEYTEPGRNSIWISLHFLCPAISSIYDNPSDLRSPTLGLELISILDAVE